jgi:hypothetical protein
VANAIVKSLQKPKLEVSVPGYLDGLMKFIRIFPRPVGEAMAKVGHTDELLSAAAGSPERAAYEQRAVESAPGLSEL